MSKLLRRITSIALLAAAAATPLTSAAQDAIIPPFASDFSSAEGLDGWTVIDNNNDGKYWEYYYGDVRISYDGTNTMDDWLITPGIQMEAGKVYDISFDTKCYGSNYPERLEVKYGKGNTVRDMGSTLFPSFDIDWSDYQNFTARLIPETSGVYFIGFHGISDPDEYYIYLKNITVSAGSSALAPGMPSNLTATPDPTGVLKCTLTFTTPTQTLLGETLTGLTAMEVLREGEVVKTFTNPGIGASLTYEDMPTEGGTITYSVRGVNSEGTGPELSTTAFVGFDEPKPLESVQIARTQTDGQVLITWTPVTEDINGLTLTENDVTYTIYKGENYYGDVIAEGVHGSSYTADLIASGEQEFVQVAVYPVTSGGTGESAKSNLIPVGTPYTSIHESMAGGKFTQAFDVETEGGAYFYLYEMGSVRAQDGDGGIIDGNVAYNPSALNVVSGIVNIDNLVNPTISFYTYRDVYGYYEYENENLISVAVRPVDSNEWTTLMAPTPITEVCAVKDVWTKVAVGIPAQYVGTPLQFMVKAERNGDNSKVYFDNFVLDSVLDHDLALTGINAPRTAKAGTDYAVSVNVYNPGANTAESYQIELYANGEVLETRDLTNLAREGKETVTFPLTMSAVQEDEITYYAKLIYASDLNDTNNQTEEVTVAPIVSTLPVATNLHKESDDFGVTLTWVRPALETMVAEEMTESFETGEVGKGEFGEWTFVDQDGATLTFNNDTENWKTGVTTGSFWVMDADAYSWAVNNPDKYSAHSGTHYIFCTHPNGWGTYNDDWAISPELSGDAQTISFWARSTSFYANWYLEQIQILYSTGSLDPADFIEIPGTTQDVPIEWTEITADLPAGAQYFAIRCFDRNNYELYIDDVTYTPVSPSTFEILGYNVYRNGVKINEELVAETTYTDYTADRFQDNTYSVTVVYKDKGESAGSNTIDIPLGVGVIQNGAAGVMAGNGRITVMNADGEYVTVAAINGSVLYSGIANGTLTIPAEAGIYIVKVGNGATKVIVK